MVSVDVGSLFANVPIEGAVQTTLWELESDPTLADRTMLTPAQIADLLDFVLRWWRLALSSRNVAIYISKWLYRETNDNTLIVIVSTTMNNNNLFLDINLFSFNFYLVTVIF